ncbi:MAG: hypothetical protein UU73_C0003G0132 [Candidatus Daviesbacteria bacterium GW2011_GWA1_41_61]|uniref:Peptidase MA-like domain-containing protein n=1 Tax=Candidatus Daviesbacteria bacterium GW2011_GWA2_40_9 TaxID=1618424 RepID=A0A0G0U7K2_9BACT|nr:MAG: hypothetical protein UU26_C0003G0094 [Candidatus Daviesbacteria bacterium GW2011_GWC1_40_9]KKR83171.1 MAG: hypothetical protein UU29_C0007G0041 [Candidatus Daviesbacteria bacterium GW2011_GWA2_40_9]KKR93518.1 MAG: hypothetical protein UU44_C0002G0179 [Candidatus Daviesbacteria bacterium GW2011_GWB1_41_15]KKS14933.1 MAG: hypothetical protein UU73_C0003G0132 [Candidatus Daviesbacteria bacterium GW2011_GWA1_41_61]
MIKNKKRELFSLSTTAKGTIYYSFDDNFIGEVKKMLQQCYRRNVKFFKREIDGVDLVLLYTRQEMDDLSGHKTPPWLVGRADPSTQSQICIFSPEVFEKVSNHNKNEFKKILCHEIAHLFTSAIHKGYRPQWFDEGLACFVAGQINLASNFSINFNPRTIFLLGTSKQWSKNVAKPSIQGYWHSWRAVSYLIKKYGKLQLLYFLSSLGDRCNNIIFYKKFRHVYNKDFLEVIKQIN